MKFHISKYINHGARKFDFPKYKKKMKQKSSISQIIINFFRVGVFYFLSTKSSLLQVLFPKIWKNFSWENVRKYFILGLESSISWKYKKNLFFWENIRNFFRLDFFKKKCKKFFRGKILRTQTGKCTR